MIKFSHYLERWVPLGSQGGGGHIVWGEWADSEALHSCCLVLKHSVVATSAPLPTSQKGVNKRRPGRSHRKPANSAPAVHTPCPLHAPDASLPCVRALLCPGEKAKFLALRLVFSPFCLKNKKKMVRNVPTPSPLSFPQFLGNEITQDINKNVLNKAPLHCSPRRVCVCMWLPAKIN